MEAEYTITRGGEPAGALVLRLGGPGVGRLDYRVLGVVLAMAVVVEDGAFFGRGLGARLVEAAVAWARESGRSVRPYSGNAARVLRSDPRYRDVLERAREP